MFKNYEFDDDPILYTTGAYIQPLKVINSDGSEIWVWAVRRFEDDTFMESGGVFNPVENGCSKEELLKADERLN